MILKILQSFDVKDDNLLKSCVAYSLKGIQHNVQDIRNVAYKCMTELYRLVGPSIMKQLDGLRPA